MIARLRNANQLRERIALRRDRLFRVALAWTGDRAEADDVVQETMAKCLDACGRLREPERLDTWLYTVMRNCWRDRFRDRLRGSANVDDMELRHDEGPAEASSRGQIVHRVRSAMASLPEGQREVIALVDIQGFSYAEVSEALEVPVGTVMSRLCRARRRLAESLSDADQLEPDAERRVTRFRRLR